MDLQIGDIIALGHPEDNFDDVSHFRVEDFDGLNGVCVYCLNGNWSGVYDPDMMILEIHAPSGKRYATRTHKVVSRNKPQAKA